MPIAPADVAAAEARLGFALHDPLRDLCLRENSGMPARCWFTGPPHRAETQVDWFLPLEPAGQPELRGIVDTYRRMTEAGVLPRSSIPFARDGGGNTFLLDRDTGRVWFMPMDAWNHAVTPEANWAEHGTVLADGLDAFLAVLTDEEPD